MYKVHHNYCTKPLNTQYVLYFSLNEDFKLLIATLCWHEIRLINNHGPYFTSQGKSTAK
jgi:hypothetical protein